MLKTTNSILGCIRQCCQCVKGDDLPFTQHWWHPLVGSGVPQYDRGVDGSRGSPVNNHDDD